MKHPGHGDPCESRTGEVTEPGRYNITDIVGFQSSGQPPVGSSSGVTPTLLNNVLILVFTDLSTSDIIY